MHHEAPPYYSIRLSCMLCEKEKDIIFFSDYDKPSKCYICDECKSLWKLLKTKFPTERKNITDGR